MNLIFKVQLNNDYDVRRVAEEIAELNYKVEIHVDCDQIVVYDAKQEEKDQIIQLITKYYSIENVIEEKTLHPIVEETLDELRQAIITEKEQKNLYDSIIVSYIKGVTREIQMIRKVEKVKVLPGSVYMCDFGGALWGENHGKKYVLILETMKDVCKVAVLDLHSSCENMPKGHMRVRNKIDVNYKVNAYKWDAILYLESMEMVSKKRLIHPSIAEATPEFMEQVFEKIRLLLPAKKKEGREKIRKRNTLNYALQQVLQPGFVQWDMTKLAEDQMEAFLRAVKIPIVEGMMTSAFIAACKMEKIDWKNITSAIQKKFSDKSKISIEKELRQELKEWLEEYPILTERYHQICLSQLLKAFVEEAKRRLIL